MVSRYLEDVFRALESKNELKKLVTHNLKLSLKLVTDRIHFGAIKIKPKKHFATKLKPENKTESPPNKINHKEYLAEFNEKQKESQEFTKKLQKAQKKRKKLQLEREEQLRQHQLKEIQEEHEAQERENHFKQLAKQEQLQKLLEKSRQRQNSLSNLKNSNKEYLKVKSLTPLFKQLESSFVSNYELPELQKRKEYLRQKHELFKPMDHETIKQHSMLVKNSKSNRINKVQRLNHSNSFVKPSKLSKVIEEDQAKAQAELEKSQKKKDLLDRKKKYSELVKEIFQPSPDSFKQKEMELIRVKLEHPVSKKTFFKVFDGEHVVKSASVKHSKVKKIVEEKKQVVVKDYIQEMRDVRERSLSNKNLLDERELGRIEVGSLKGQRMLRKRIEMMDKVAREKEISIGYLSPFNNKSLEVTEQVNGLLVSSIKAKMAILDQVF